MVLRRVSLELPTGSCTLLLGGNGSGKSTLLSILSGRLAPTRGTLTYDDVDWLEADEETRARIGVVGHPSMLYRDLSGRENLDFTARMFGLGTSGERRRLVDEALLEVGMADTADRAVGKCSQGMVRRLAVARALLPRPGLLLLDEPFAGLDKVASARLVATLAGVKKAGATLVIVTHDPAPLAALCDRVAVLSAGRLVHAGQWTGDAAGLESLLLEHLGATD